MNASLSKSSAALQHVVWVAGVGVSCIDENISPLMSAIESRANTKGADPAGLVRTALSIKDLAKLGVIMASDMQKILGPERVDMLGRWDAGCAAHVAGMSLDALTERITPVFVAIGELSSINDMSQLEQISRMTVIRQMGAFGNLAIADVLNELDSALEAAQEKIDALSGGAL